MLRMGLGMVAILTPLQMYIGDASGLNTEKYQPEKIAAIEAHWDGNEPGALVLFAIPNEAEERNDFAISIPNASSWLITHSGDGLFPGLKNFPRRRPAAGDPGVLRLQAHGRHGRAYADRRLGRRMAVGARAAVQDALVSRRPPNMPGRWGSSPFSPAGTRPRSAASHGSPTASCEPRTRPRRSRGSAVLTTLVLFVIVYACVFAMGIYYINRLIEHGPKGAAAEVARGAALAAARGGGRGRARSDRGGLSHGRDPASGFRSCGRPSSAPRWRSTSSSMDSIWASASSSPSSPSEKRRDIMMNSVAPFWDGNETWLVLGGGGLFVAFPLAYAVIMPALYLPIIIMLLGLVFRGVAFEFRWAAKPSMSRGTMPSPAARSSPHSCRASCSAGSCRASTSKNSAFAGGPWTGSRRFRCSRALPGRGLRAACAAPGSS